MSDNYYRELGKYAARHNRHSVYYGAFHWLRHLFLYRRLRLQHKQDMWLNRVIHIKWVPWFTDEDKE